MSELYRVLACFRDGKNLQFMFRSEATSLKAYDDLTAPPIITGAAASCRITDDYGNKACIRIDDLSGVVHTHVSEDLNSQQDLAILQAHGQVKLNNRIGADPMLKAAMAMQQMNGMASMV